MFLRKYKQLQNIFLEIFKFYLKHFLLQEKTST